MKKKKTFSCSEGVPLFFFYYSLCSICFAHVLNEVHFREGNIETIKKSLCTIVEFLFGLRPNKRIEDGRYWTECALLPREHHENDICRCSPSIPSLSMCNKVKVQSRPRDAGSRVRLDGVRQGRKRMGAPTLARSRFEVFRSGAIGGRVDRYSLKSRIAESHGSDRRRSPEFSL